MSQEDIRRLLLEAGGEAAVTKLESLAQETYSNDILHTFLIERLQAMEKKGLVEKVEEPARWRLTEKGESTSARPPEFSEIDAIVSRSELEEANITIGNLVGSLPLERELDLQALTEDLNNTQYHPETYPSMIYRVSTLNGMSVLVPATGRLAIVGETDKDELIKGIQQFLDELQNLGIEISKTTDDILAQNIVATLDFEREFDLELISLSLELENIEYEPEQFSGLIYRSSTGATGLIFATGKCVITGVKTYDEVLDVKNEIVQKLRDSGFDI